MLSHARNKTHISMHGFLKTPPTHTRLPRHRLACHPDIHMHVRTIRGAWSSGPVLMTTTAAAPASAARTTLSSNAHLPRRTSTTDPFSNRVHGRQPVYACSKDVHGGHIRCTVGVSLYSFSLLRFYAQKRARRTLRCWAFVNGAHPSIGTAAAIVARAYSRAEWLLC